MAPEVHFAHDPDLPIQRCGISEELFSAGMVYYYLLFSRDIARSPAAEYPFASAPNRAPQCWPDFYRWQDALVRRHLCWRRLVHLGAGAAHGIAAAGRLDLGLGCCSGPCLARWPR